MVESLAEARSHTISPEAFLRHDEEMRTAKREKDDAAAALARIKKTAKNDAVDLKAYKFIEQLRRLEDDEQIIFVRHVMQYIEWLQMPIGTQFSLMDAPKVPPVKQKAKAEHEAWQAGEDGLLAGREGRAASSNPFIPGTDKYAAWARRHADGLAERATAARMTQNGHDVPVADAGRATAGPGPKATKRGRGRPRKNGALALDNTRRHLGDLPVH